MKATTLRAQHARLVAKALETHRALLGLSVAAPKPKKKPKRPPTPIRFERTFGEGFIRVEIHGLRLASEQNLRESWQATMRRKKSQQTVVRHALLGTRVGLLYAPLKVTFTRCGPKLFDDDGNVAAHKHVRDQVARTIGIDDGDVRLRWVYAPQKIGPYAVTILIEEAR